ncbi:hypothetical protein [Methylobacterium brachythecii]|nr:hypothetical protein [Methylobacterium brachythecii]MBB3903652.1 hypothetical protein [Methylobacterium brachythecii]
MKELEFSGLRVPADVHGQEYFLREIVAQAFDAILVDEINRERRETFQFIEIIPEMVLARIDHIHPDAIIHDWSITDKWCKINNDQSEMTTDYAQRSLDEIMRGVYKKIHDRLSDHRSLGDFYNNVPSLF